MSTLVCSYKGCEVSRKRNPGTRMFRFPKSSLQEIWVRNCGNPDLIGLNPIKLSKNKLLCQNHFADKDILPSGRLLYGAVPECCSILEDVTPITSESQEKMIHKVKPEHVYINVKKNSSKVVPGSFDTPWLLRKTASSSLPIASKSDSFTNEQDLSEDPLANSVSNTLPRYPVIQNKRNTSSIDKSTNTTHTYSLANILETANVLALDIENILNVDICNSLNVDPKQRRTLTSINNEPTFSNIKSNIEVLELKLRMHYLKTMIKNEEEISNLKKEVYRLQIAKEKTMIKNEEEISNLKKEVYILQIAKEKMEIKNKREIHLQRLENFKLKH